MTAYDAIEALPTEWLWPGRIPRGEVTLIAGEGGSGKGMLTVDLAARVSSGRSMPGAENPNCWPWPVVLVTPEDDESETVAWRLRAAQAELANVHDLTITADGGPFLLSADQGHPGSVGELRELVDRTRARLVVVDPLLACIGWGTVMTNLGARRVVAPLQRLARETGAAVLLTHHTVKSGSIAGSRGLVDAVRIVYLVTRDRDNPGTRILSLHKSNVLGETADLRYTIEGDGHDARVVWSSAESARARQGWRGRVADVATFAVTGRPYI